MICRSLQDPVLRYLSNKARDLELRVRSICLLVAPGVGNLCQGVRHPSDTFLLEAIGSNAAPLEVGELAGEFANVQVSPR
jgi:hypothetical protein